MMMTLLINIEDDDFYEMIYDEDNDSDNGDENSD